MASLDGGEVAMDKNQRNTIEGWISKADNQLSVARQHHSRFEHSECVQAAQQCIELSIKAVSAFLCLDYPRTHGWKHEELARVVEQIQAKPLVDRLAELGLPVRLPRLLLIAKFWGELYILAKYGIQDRLLASARDLFEREEAELSIKHAEECSLAACVLRGQDEATLSTIRGPR
jgi:HEPN domain-containing protein